MADQKTVIKTLCRLIATGNEVVRCYVSRALGVLGNANTIPILVQCLRDEDIDVSIDAANALGNIRNVDAIPPLLESLKHDPNSEVKIAIVEALSKIGGQDVIPPLLEIAESCPNTMVWDDTSDWNDWWDMQLKAVEALGRMRVADAVPILTAILEDEESQDIESEVLKALALIGGEGEVVLIKRLEQGLARERRRAATALSLSNSANTRKALVRAFLDKDINVRVAALHALGKLGASQYLDIILRFLNDPEPEMRAAVIEVSMNLSIIDDNTQIMLDKLVPLLSDSNPAIRAATLTALQNLEPLPLLEQIRQCLTDPNNTVISAACTLLAHLGDKQVLITLLQILADKKRDINLRSQAATALGTLGNAEAVNILTWAIKDKAQPVRLAALNALMQLKRYDIVIAALISLPIIKENQSDTKTEIEIKKFPAMSTLDAITMDNLDTIELHQNYEEKSEKISQEIQEYVNIVQENIELGERLFVQQKLDIETDVQYLSARILGDCDNEQAIKALVEVLNYNDPILRREAINSLGQIAARSPEKVANAFDNFVAYLNDPEMRLACVQILGLLGNKAAIPALMNCLQNEDISVLIQTMKSIVAIISTNVEKITPDDVNAIIAQLINLLHNSDAGVRKQAASALAILGYTPALDAIIEAAFANQGAIARDIGKTLRILDIEQSSDKLLTMLNNISESSQIGFVIQMLEEIFLTKQEYS
jgi:HEAT repeat protein